MIAADFATRLDKIHGDLAAGARVNSRGYDWRMDQLRALRRLFTENEDAVCEALRKDLNKPRFECVATEHGVVLSEIEDALKNLRAWMNPRRYFAPLYNQPGSCEVRYDSLGLALIIGAWNYPINLLLAPLVAAIAGGNSVLLKPSELADATAKLLVRLIPKYMDPASIGIIEAGPEETSLILDKKFDTIFYTGSGHVGKIVMTKAAAQLTPVTLELGGKSPCVVTADADLKVAAKRIAWGKFMNAGQTCVAPDYVIVQPAAKARLVAELKAALLEFYGANPEATPDYCRIVNERNFDRLKGLMDGEKILHGGQAKRETLYMGPTLLDCTFASPIMKDEIFGPLLPIVEMESTSEMVEAINKRDRPLALYVFSGDKATQEKFLRETTSGGACINDVVMHMPVASIPFGGVGASGMGHYHGIYGFRTFTHSKAVLRKATWIDLSLRYAPYTPSKIKWLKRLF
ncbi:MAG: aldehyde dehydrogenase family protein [Proteobacteria bacterium]|nr:MAG: aldehyde dehydrogenase family protein [Pseudomonadota bacterium]